MKLIPIGLLIVNADTELQTTSRGFWYTAGPVGIKLGAVVPYKVIAGATVPMFDALVTLAHVNGMVLHGRHSLLKLLPIE